YDIAEYERDRLHREISRRQGKLTQRITFDALGRMTNKRTAFNDLGSHALPLIDKRFDYDKVGNLIQQVNGYGNYPAQTLDSRARYSQRYEYDAAQQVVMQREYTNQQHFVYDPAGNLFNEQGDVCRANQLRQYNGYHYDYDGFGRLIKRQRPAENITQWFSYNHEHQLIEARVESLQHRSITQYQYDALGRRINKTTEHYDKYSQRYTTTGTDFSWQGMRLSGEANAQQQIRYLYNGQDYEPIARAISDRYPKTSDVHYQIEYFHTLANSLPTELTNEDGEIIWLGEYTLFGQLKHQRNRDRWYSSDKTEQNLRFAGQYYDQETGLHYNTLRYYDPNCGRFTQQDPIGLAGGINLYRYAPNTLSWIDPWGLACTPKVTRGAQKQPLSAEVTIGKADIKTGTATNPSSRAWARALGNSNDDAGHILGKVLGGSGGKDNVFPQLSSINRGGYRKFEDSVRKYIERTGNDVNLKWRFEYENGGTRPKGIVYEVFDNAKRVLVDIFEN
ncbi:RHS repeat-associated protein, partial [Frischella perrara]